MTSNLITKEFQEIIKQLSVDPDDKTLNKYLAIKSKIINPRPKQVFISSGQRKGITYGK